MSLNLFAGDLHFGAKNIHTHRNFSSSEEHDTLVFENIIRRLNKRTTLTLLGDICFTKDSLKYIRAFKETGCKLILYPGNHCTEHIKMTELCTLYDEVHASAVQHSMWFSHQPLHQDHLRDRLCVHGHLHYNIIPDARYLNVSLENTNMSVIDLDQLRQIFLDRVDRKLLPASYIKKCRLLPV